MTKLLMQGPAEAYFCGDGRAVPSARSARWQEAGLSVARR